MKPRNTIGAQWHGTSIPQFCIQCGDGKPHVPVFFFLGSDLRCIETTPNSPGTEYRKLPISSYYTYSDEY
jgi:hypothetical protein